MHSILITLAIVAALLLIHFSYVDFRFRYRDGVRWFWMLNPAPPMMWVGRATLFLSLVLALSIPFVGIGPVFAYALGGVIALHFISLILLEVLEPR